MQVNSTMTKNILIAVLLIGIAICLYFIIKAPTIKEKTATHTEYIAGKIDTVNRFILRKDTVFVKVRELPDKPVITLDTIIYVDNGKVYLFSDDIQAKGIMITTDLPVKEIYQIDTLKITDSVFVDCEVSWYEKPEFVIPVSALVTIIVENLVKSK